MSDADVAPPLTDVEAEGFAQFVAGLQALACEPVEVLIEARVVPNAAAARTFRDDPLTRLHALDASAVVAFWRLALRIHADRRSGARAD